MLNFKQDKIRLVVLKSRGKGPYSTLSIGQISDSFPGMLIYVLFLENCQNIISVPRMLRRAVLNTTNGPRSA